MKNSLYIVAGLLALLWAIITFGFYSFRYFDLLLLAAGFMVLLQILFNKKSPRNYNDKKL
ncbi:MAG TPA: hypothetical protein VKA10_05690 [Prolixibacteraceae bacterium]|nr:hypothetical protein [Prolixibacteraceae bacterium]